MKRNPWQMLDLKAGGYALLWHTVSISLALLIAVLLVVIEPFNLDQGLSERGRVLFYKVAGFAYPKSKTPKTAVVTVDTKFVVDRELAWPMTYRVHAQVLEEIASHHPRAIFIDLPFVWQRPDPTLDELRQAILHIATTTPIYIAAAPTSDGVGVAIPEILQLRDLSHNVKFVSIKAGSTVGGGDAYLISASNRLTPAAVQIFNDQHPKQPPLKARHLGDQIDIWWAAPKSEFNCRGDQERFCGYLAQGPLRRFFFVAVSGFLPQPHGVGDDPTVVPIAYAPTLSTADLFSGDARNEVTSALQDATVFYGANVALSGDRTHSVIQGDLPGVHAHAMAFDNLSKFNGRYISTGAPFGMGNKLHNVLWLVLIALVSLAARLAATQLWPILALQPHVRGGYFSTLDVVVALTVGVTLAIVEFTVWRVGPGAWATVLVAALSGSALSTRAFSGWVVLVLTGRLDIHRRLHKDKRIRDRKMGVKWPFMRP